MNAPTDASDPSSITLHSTWRGVFSSLLGALVVVGLGFVGVVFNGPRVVPVALMVVGWLLVLGVMADYPVASSFDAAGVTRRAMIRRHRLAWDSADQLTRARPSILAIRKKAVQGGLTAVVGRRRYLLVDVVESADEHDRLLDIIDGAVPELGVLRRPELDVPPTWLYRRPHWRPESAR